MPTESAPRLRRSAAALVAVRVAGVLCQLLVLTYLANRLSLPQMAVFALAYSGLGLVRVLGALGIDHASVRLLSVQLGAGTAPPMTRKMAEAAHRLAAAGLFLALLSGLILALPTAGLIAVLTATPPQGPAPATSPLALWSLVAAVPAQALMGVMVGQIRGLGRNLSAQWPEALGLHLTTLALLLVLGAQAALPALALASWGVVCLQLLLRHRALRQLCPPHTPADRAHGHCPDLAGARRRQARFGRAECAALLRCGWPILQAQGVSALATRAPLFLAALTTGPAAVAVLEVALRFGTLPSLLTGSVGATFSPAVARQAARADQAALRQSRRTIGRLAGGPALLYLMACPLLAGPLLGWMLPDAYQAAVLPLTLIAFGSLLNAGFAGASFQLLMSSRAVLVRRYAMLRLGILCALSVMLGPLWGAVGIALAVAAGYAVADTGMALAVRRGEG